MKGLIDEGENVAVIYIDGQPVAKYTKKHEAEDSAELIRKKFPNKKIEIKQEVREAEGDTLHDPEYSLPQARRITKAIKYDGTVGEIITEIQMLAERTEGIDSKTLEYSIDGVLSAKNALESAVYGLEEAFEDAARNAQYKRDDVDEGNYHDNRTGFKRGPRDDERHDLDVQKPSREEWGLKINGKVWSKDGKDVTFASKEQALKARQTLLAKRPELEIGLVTRNVSETLDENLKQWFKEKWVRFGPDGKIRGDCARGDDSEGKPKCLPQSKAQNLGKEGRASAAARKRREDPNPERSGKAINVNTKKKSNEAELDEACWKGYHKEGNKKMFGKTYPNCVKNTNEELDMTEGWKEESQELEDWSKEVNMRLYKAHESQRPALARQLSKIEQKNFGSSLNKGLLTQLVHSTLMALQKGQMVHYDPQSVGQMPFGNIVGDDARIIASSGLKKYDVDGYRGLKRAGIVDTIEQFLHLRDLADNQGQAILKYANMPPVAAWMQFIKDIGWSKDDMNEEVQAKTDDKLLAYYAQRKAEKEKQHSESCPHCGGELVSEELMHEKQDACYHKVKSRYKVWPSAYASGALVQCRKKGASNWGNGGKKNESVSLSESDSSEAVYNAVLNRIMRRHLDLLQEYGPKIVMYAIEDVANGVGDLDEIGSSDVSIWTKQVISDLQSGQYAHLKETPTGLPVEGQPSGRRIYRPKSAGTFAEDTAYAGGMGQGGNAGQSYRKFKPKSAGTFKESSIMKGLKSESK
jgi:hypothetical protein